ncbi:ATP-binding protein [Rhizobium sp. BK251]|uniref:ATP-binding protein n=1 Tax=Rhizobium sp. BK251 TaxID=2512125 RepID=UPI001048834F|nr:ATP-binding protein [Rhizobium sp. BK251]TCL69877.1 signal transduction histidine kinase [Rhizobium sp. BK251]
MRKLGLVSRIILIVALALFAIQLVALFATSIKQEAPVPRHLSPMLQVVSAVRLFDGISPEAQELAAQALTAGGVNVRLADTPPADGGEKLMDPGWHHRLKSDLSGETRFLRVRGLPERPKQWFSVGRADRTIEVTVGITGGRVAVFDIPDTPTVRLRGIPVGFMAGLLGLLVAVIAVCAVARETRPLTRLSRHVNSLGNGLTPVKIPEEGACELRSLIRAINEMQLRIAALVNNRTLMLGAISHDLRTYLTRFRLRMEMMPETPHREKAIADVEAMEQLVEDALGFAHSTIVADEKEELDLAAAVRSALDERHDSAEKVSLQLPEGAVPVAISRTALRRVLDNLVGNAVRYGGRADITVERRKGLALLVVADRGPGIPAEKRREVLEPFVRLEESRNRELGGNGLGLTIVKQILDAHNGLIAFEDRPGGGLTAIVSLPLISENRAAA